SLSLQMGSWGHAADVLIPSPVARSAERLSLARHDVVHVMDVARVDVRERDGENAEGLTIAELVLQDGLDELLTGRQGFSACRHHRVDLGDGELVVAVRRDRGAKRMEQLIQPDPQTPGTINARITQFFKAARSCAAEATSR